MLRKFAVDARYALDEHPGSEHVKGWNAAMAAIVAKIDGVAP